MTGTVVVLNIASAITPGGLGVVEVTLVAVTVGFGAPRFTAVLAVLGYRIVNYRLPLIPGAIAHLRLRLVNEVFSATSHEHLVLEKRKGACGPGDEAVFSRVWR